VIVGFASCGDDAGDEDGTTTTPGVDSDGSADPEKESENVVIETEVHIEISEGGPQTGDPQGGGKVLDGSSLGDSPFCPGGTFRDRHGDAEIGLVDRTFRCSGGSLRIGFTPGVPEDPQTQNGPWNVVSGTGDFEGIQGHGEMEIKYEPGTHGSEGRETFTGTIVQ